MPASTEVSLSPLALGLPLSEVGADFGGVEGAVVPLAFGGVVGADEPVPLDVVPLVGGGAVLVVPVVPDVAPPAACVLRSFCLSLLSPRIPVHLGLWTLRSSKVCCAEMARCDVDQQRRVAVFVRRTEQVIVLARVKKPLGDLDPILQSWTGSGPLLIGEGVSPLKDAAHEAVYIWNCVPVDRTALLILLAERVFPPSQR